MPVDDYKKPLKAGQEVTVYDRTNGKPIYPAVVAVVVNDKNVTLTDGSRFCLGMTGWHGREKSNQFRGLRPRDK